MAVTPIVKVENIVMKAGAILIDGRPIGATQEKVLLATTKLEKPIDFIAQYPGVEIDRRVLGVKYHIRFNMLEATLDNLRLALDLDTLIYDGNQKILYAGHQPLTRFVKKHTIEIYGEGENGCLRKFYAYKAAFVDPGEFPLATPDDPAVIPVTLQLFPDLTKPADRSYFYIVDYLTTIPIVS